MNRRDKLKEEKGDSPAFFYFPGMAVGILLRNDQDAFYCSLTNTLHQSPESRQDSTYVFLCGPNGDCVSDDEDEVEVKGLDEGKKSQHDTLSRTRQQTKMQRNDKASKPEKYRACKNI